MPKFFKSLFGQVLLALLLGVALGFAVPEFAVKLKPLGDSFIKLIKMIIPVLVFCVVVHGIAGAGDLKRVGRVGVKALIYFEVVTTIALVLGLVLAFWFQPGVGMNVDPNALDAKARAADPFDRGGDFVGFDAGPGGNGVGLAAGFAGACCLPAQGDGGGTWPAGGA